MKLKIYILLGFLFLWFSGFSQDYTEYLPAGFNNSQWFNTKSINNSYDISDTAYYTSRTQSGLLQYHKINRTIKSKTEYWSNDSELFCNLINVYNVGNEIHLVQGKCDEEPNNSNENLNHFWVYNGRKEFVFDFEIEIKGCDPVYSGKKVAGFYYFIVPINAKKCILIEIDIGNFSLRMQELIWKGFRFNTRIIGSVKKGNRDYLVLNSHFSQIQSYNMALIDVQSLRIEEQWRSDRNMIGITQAENGDFFILAESNDIDSQYVEFHLCRPDLTAYESKRIFLAFKRSTNLFFNRTAANDGKFYCAITNNQFIDKAASDYVFALNDNLDLQRIIVYPFYIANMDIQANLMTAWNPQSNYNYPIVDYKLDAFNCPTPEICETTEPTDSLRFSKEEFIESLREVSFSKNTLPKILKRTSRITYERNEDCADENVVTELNLLAEDYCQGEELNYFAQPISENTYTFRLVDQNFNPINSSLEYNQIIQTEGREPGTYHLILNDAFLRCKLTDTVTFEVHKTPKVDIKPSVINICRGDSVRISPSAEDFDYFQWKLNGSRISASLNTHFKESGDYNLELHKGECVASDQFTIKYIEGVPKGRKAKDTITCEESRIALRPMSFNHQELRWSDGSTDYYLWVEEEGMYTVEGFFECGKSIDTIIVDKEYCPTAKPVYLPNVFTPNGDGINDLFPQQGFQEIPYSIQIFNRWGELIFSCGGIDCHWDGRINTKDASDGVYIYYLNIEKKTYQGDITLIR